MVGEKAIVTLYIKFTGTTSTLITGFHDDFDIHDQPSIRNISEPFLMD